MEFGFSIPLFEEPGARDPYARTYELCQLAEELGFYVGTLGHHSFTPDAGDPSAPFVLLSAIAARTSQLRLSTGIFLLPLHHPVAVAEQVATLDRVSGGRAILGVGVGYREYEYEGFGVPYRRRGRRMDESLRLIRQAFETGSCAFDGAEFSVPALELDPRPLQSPLPIWVGAVARAAQERTARLGDAWISDLMQTLPVEERLAARYRDFCSKHDRRPRVVLMRNGWVAKTRADVERDWLDRSLKFHLDYWRAGARGRDDEGIYERLERGERVPLAEFARDRAIAGTPEDCIAQIERCREATDCDVLLMGFAGDRSFEKIRGVIELFGREVVPAFRDQEA
jgi:probable F420-dependent oxidoreductase